MKNYYLTYAVKAADSDMDKVAQHVAELLSMEAVTRSSSYMGDYVTFKGAAADRLSITPRNQEVFPADADYGAYSLMLFAQNYIGKNMDKESRHSRIKEKLTKLPGMLLLEETVEESKN